MREPTSGLRRAGLRVAGPHVELHVERRDLALYVLGGLEGARLDEVEAHVLSCEACAVKLAQEAQLETALGEVALRMTATEPSERAVVAGLGLERMRARSPRARAMRSGRFMGGALGALAAAAGIVLMFAQTSHADTVTATQPRSSAFDGAPGMMGDISGALSFEGKNASGAERGDNLDGG